MVSAYAPVAEPHLNAARTPSFGAAFFFTVQPCLADAAALQPG
jgi:hypothetical protein